MFYEVFSARRGWGPCRLAAWVTLDQAREICSRVPGAWFQPMSKPDDHTKS